LSTFSPPLGALDVVAVVPVLPGEEELLDEPHPAINITAQHAISAGKPLYIDFPA
jgi:hypothetical protein